VKAELIILFSRTASRKTVLSYSGAYFNHEQS